MNFTKNNIRFSAIFGLLALGILQCKKAPPPLNVVKYKLVPGVAATQRSSVIPLSDGNILLRSYNGFSTSGLILKKITPTGEVLWDKDFLLTGLYQYGFGTESENGNLFFSTRGYNQSNTKLEFRIVKVSPTGGHLWNRAYFVSQRYYMPGPLATCADGNLIATYTFSDSTDFKYKSVVNKIDEEGVVIWQKVFTGGTSPEALQSVMELPGGEIVLLSSGYDYNVHLRKLDASGTLVWDQLIAKENAGDRENGYSLTWAENGNIMVCGEHFDQKKANYQVLLMQVDLNGNLVWRKNLGYDTRNEIGNCITRGHSGSFLIAAQSSSTAAAGTEALAMLVNSEGNPGYYRAFGPGTQNYGLGIISQQNNSCTLIGACSIVENGITTWNVLLSQLNAKGEFE